MVIVSELKEGEVFVFGSNLEGKHFGGAARTAMDKFGAEPGVSEGMTGDCYAIPTCVSPGVPFESISYLEPYVQTFLDFAEVNPDLVFLVTPIGTGIAGFELEEVDELFGDLIPFNVILLWR